MNEVGLNFDVIEFVLVYSDKNEVRKVYNCFIYFV